METSPCCLWRTKGPNFGRASAPASLPSVRRLSEAHRPTSTGFRDLEKSLIRAGFGADWPGLGRASGCQFETRNGAEEDDARSFPPEGSFWVQ